MYKYILLIISSLAVICCRNRKDNNNWSNRNIKIIQTDKKLFQGELQKTKTSLFLKKTIKIVTFLDGNCCFCVQEFKKWNDFIKLSNQEKDFQLYIYLYTSDINIYKKYKYPKSMHIIPLLIDENKSFLTENNLPQWEKTYQTFLLDSNNQIILTGNPIYSEKLMKLYKEEINKRLN